MKKFESKKINDVMVKTIGSLGTTSTSITRQISLGGSTGSLPIEDWVKDGLIFDTVGGKFFDGSQTIEFSITRLGLGNNPNIDQLISKLNN
jgi:hypothetical protein